MLTRGLRGGFRRRELFFRFGNRNVNVVVLFLRIVSHATAATATVSAFPSSPDPSPPTASSPSPAMVPGSGDRWRGGVVWFPQSFVFLRGKFASSRRRTRASSSKRVPSSSSSLCAVSSSCTQNCRTAPPSSASRGSRPPSVIRVIRVRCRSAKQRTFLTRIRVRIRRLRFPGAASHAFFRAFPVIRLSPCFLHRDTELGFLGIERGFDKREPPRVFLLGIAKGRNAHFLAEFGQRDGNWDVRQHRPSRPAPFHQAVPHRGVEIVPPRRLCHIHPFLANGNPLVIKPPLLLRRAVRRVRSACARRRGSASRFEILLADRLATGFIHRAVHPTFRGVVEHPPERPTVHHHDILGRPAAAAAAAAGSHAGRKRAPTDLASEKSQLDFYHL